MKHLGETIVSIDDKVISYIGETQNEYIMQFFDLMPKLYALAKLTKDISTWHGRIIYLKYKNLLWMTKYVLGIEDLSAFAPNEICGW